VAPAPDDAVIVRRVLGGEVDAYARLVERHRDRLARYAVRMLGDPEDAEEALQDAFVRGYRSLATCKDPARFGPWLFRILVNRCRTKVVLRQRRSRTFVRDEVALATAGVAALDERGAWREEIALALGALDPLYREAFLLKHVEELEYEEMAKLTGVRVSALKMRVKRACDRLRDLLQEAESAAR
jgi:RNA polymerase sigma-70 factor (ECF subfamily)